MPLLSLLCHRFFPVINFLPLPRCTTRGINHRLPWRRSHPCEGDALSRLLWRASARVFVLRADCTCLSTRPRGGLRWGRGCTSSQSGCDSCLVGERSPDTLGFLCRLLHNNDRAPKERDDKKDTERCQARFASPQLKKLT